MTDSQDRVSLELIEAGDHKDRVIQVLSKVKGLTMSPEQIVNSTPCTIAANVPRPLAEKLQGFLEQVGAMVLIEGEDDLFSPDDLPMETEEDALVPAPGDAIIEEDEEEFSAELAPPTEEDWLADAFPQASSRDDELMGDFQAASFGEEDAEMDEDEEADYEIDREDDEASSKKSGRMSQFFARFSKEKGEKSLEAPKKKLSLPAFSLPKLGKTRQKELPEAESEAEAEAEPTPKTSFFDRFRKTRPQTGVETEAEMPAPETGDAEEPVSEKHALPDYILRALIPAIIGFLVGATIMGVWGWSSIRSTQREAELETERRIQAYDQQVAQQIEQHSAGLKASLEEQQAQIAQLTQQNAELTRQLQQAGANTPTGIMPTLEPGTLPPAEAAIVSAFEEVKTRHAQSLEAGEAAQRQGGCSRQILLDGESTETYAQIVRTFSARYTSFDVVRSDSLRTPYQAELKIPFQEEIRTGGSEAACNAAQFQRQPTDTVHHEFGSFYGYWIIQYEYRNGQWRVKPTVIEKNRDLYESAFQNGSPDSAKFLLDTTLFPELRNE